MYKQEEESWMEVKLFAKGGLAGQWQSCGCHTQSLSSFSMTSFKPAWHFSSPLSTPIFGPHPDTVVKHLLCLLSHSLRLSDFLQLALGACLCWLGFLQSSWKIWVFAAKNKIWLLWLSCTLCLAACSTLCIWVSLWGKDLFHNCSNLYIIMVYVSAVLCKL